MTAPEPRTEALGSPYGVTPVLAECPVAYCLVRPDRLEEHVTRAHQPRQAQALTEALARAARSAAR